jgi:hypothetical protein
MAAILSILILCLCLLAFYIVWTLLHVIIKIIAVIVSSILGLCLLLYVTIIGTSIIVNMNEKIEQPSYAIPVPNNPGFYVSPYEDKGKLIDARGISSNSTIVDPYSNKKLLIP